MRNQTGTTGKMMAIASALGIAGLVSTPHASYASYPMSGGKAANEKKKRKRKEQRQARRRNRK